MNKHAQALGKKGGVAGRGAAKARTSEQASAAAQARWRVLDNDGSEVNEGDWIGFSYGTPPVGVRAQVVRRGKSLFALTPEHTPAECNLRSLRRYVGEWYLLPSSPNTPAHDDPNGTRRVHVRRLSNSEKLHTKPA